jgi:hypothetical protein
MLVEQAQTYSGAVTAVFERAKGMQYVDHLHIEAMPLLGFILVLANRQGLTDEQVRRIDHRDDLRDLARRGAEEGQDTEEKLAGFWILRWLNEPIESERAHQNMVWSASSDFLV